MAMQNLFEKYGIKDVADVTLYRIEKKEESYEAQRTISVASVLKGAVELRTVYPFSEGVSTEDGFEAYVFTDADIILGANYDCDDETNPDTDGIFPDRESSTRGDENYRPTPGTHEYSYAEQAFMLFAKRQNLITKTGTRFSFGTEDEIKNYMSGLTFEDNYSTIPNSAERVVVLGPSAGFDTIGENREAFWSEANYDVEEVSGLISKLTETFSAKAYDVTYDLYAELVVEDEMGYYAPKFLGNKYDKTDRKVIFTNLTEGNVKKSYIDSVGGTELDGTSYDRHIANATMWGKGEHYSINDAIDALREQLKKIDADSTTTTGITNVYGGYAVTDEALPNVGESDTKNENARYFYAGKSEEAPSGVRSTYNLAAVLNALADLNASGVTGEVQVDYGVQADSEEASNADALRSNRAIYVDISDANTAANSYIYLLRNKNYKDLVGDNEGIFTFYDKVGNKLYYQDTIFAGIEYLALVIIGTAAMIFVVNRHSNKEVSRVAWMVSDTGFVNDKAAKKLVNSGLIHTVDITDNDETFEATCSVKSLSVRTTVKKVNRYVPVLFLDTLKVSTIEQTAEETYATGGHGNANLVGWDFGKEITLSLEDALFTPASFSAIMGADDTDLSNGVKATKKIDRTEKVMAKRSFIVPEGNQNGTPTEADNSAQAVFIDPNTMKPYPDGTPIAEGETFLKWTRSVAYEGHSIGNTIEISADKFPGTYKVVGETYIKNKDTGKDERFQFVIPQAKMNSERTITLEADGEPVVFDFDMTVLRPDDGVMIRFIQYNVVENTVENDGSTMVVGTENLNLLDDAELFKVGGASNKDDVYIGATEY